MDNTSSWQGCEKIIGVIVSVSLAGRKKKKKMMMMMTEPEEETQNP